MHAPPAPRSPPRARPNIATDQTLSIPLHQQPMARAVRQNVSAVPQPSDDKARLWLARMAP